MADSNSNFNDVISKEAMDTLKYASKPAKAIATPTDDAKMVEGMEKEQRSKSRALEEKYKSEMGPLQKEFSDKAGEPHPDKPQYEDVLSHQDLEKAVKEGQQSAQEWAGVAAAVSALIGGISKTHTLAGLSALSGGIQGLKEGNDAAAKQKMDLFRESNDAIVQHNKTVKDSYDAILADRKLSLDDIKEKISQKAYEFNDLLAVQQLEKGNIQGFTNFLKERDKKVSSLTDLADTVTDSSGKIIQSNNLHGQQYLDFLESANPTQKAVLSEIKAIGDYKNPPRVPRAGSKVDPQAEAIMDAVRQYNPDYDTRKYASTLAASTTLARAEVPHRIGDTEVSIQKVNHHLDTLQTAMDALESGDVRKVNSAAQTLSREFGDPKIVSAETAVNAVSQEFHRVYVPTGGVEDERAAAASNLSPSSSPDQIKAAIKTMKELMLGQAQALKTVADTVRSGASVEDLNVPSLSDTPGNAPAPPPVPGARQAPDGKFYVPDPDRPGKYLMVQ